MQRILMATDLTARSDRALARAVGLAREHGSALTIVHVVDDDLPALLAEAQAQAATDSVRAQLASLAPGDDTPVSTEVVSGRAYVGILDLAAQYDADLIVLGMHRADSFKDMFRGTTAERVIRAGSAPVLLVNLDGYWDPLLEMVAHQAEAGFVRPQHQGLFQVVDGIEALFTALEAARAPSVKVDSRRL